jgi:GT2 family glycosyltransferase
MKFYKAVCYSNSLSEEDSLAYLRLIAPLKYSGIEIVNGIENYQVYVDRVLDGDFVIIQREFPKDFPNYQKIRKIAHLERKPVVFDLDDQLFYLPENHPDRHSGRYGLSLLPMYQALIDADLVSVTTPALRDFVKDYNENVVLLPNYLDDRLWNIQKEAKTNLNKEYVTIGYMGGITHKPDLEYLVPVFREINKRYPKRIRFKFWGVKPPEEVMTIPKVEWIPPTTNKYEDFAKFFQTQSADIFIAPLIDTPFNRSKSAIKFLEYSALGIPGVFSRLETYTGIVTHGHNGFLAYSHDEWISSLVELIEDEELRCRLAMNALETTRSNWLLSKKYTVWKDGYESALKNQSQERRIVARAGDLITSLNQQLYEAHKNVESLLNDHSVKLAENENKISKYISLVAEHEQEIQSINNQLHERESLIQDLSRQELESDEEIQILNREISRKDKVILAFSTQVIENDKRNQTLQHEISEMKGVVQELLTQGKSDESKLKSLENRIKAKEKEIQRLTNKVNRSEKELTEIIASKAWKLALFFRRMRVYLAPPGSLRSRIIQRLIYFRVSPFIRNEKIMKEMALLRSSELFDENYYIAQNPDIARENIDPHYHYLRHGGFEGRDPGPDFSSSGYLEAYPDVRETGLNPLIHYIKFGKGEGRIPITNVPHKFSADLLVDKQEPQNISLFQKVIHAWKEGGLHLVWQKTGQKIRWVLDKQRLRSAQKQLGLENAPNFQDQINIGDLNYQPLVSVLIPTYNTPVKYLNAAVDSVRNQFYPNWEIVICDDGSTDRSTLKAIKKIKDFDERIKVEYLYVNCGISVATNQAAEIAEGEYFAFLDHDDELTLNALYEMVAALNNGEQFEVIYSDQDKIDSNGRVQEPFYKPDWSPVYLRSVMYVGHLLFVKRELFQKMKGFNSHFDGVQDYEFILRVSEINSRVKHIPKILYHWRKISGSVAMGLDAKGDKIENLQVKAVNEHFSRLGISATANKHPVHRHRVLVEPNQRDDYPLISLIVLTKDQPYFLKQCLQSIFNLTTYPKYEVIVVDNGSTDPEAIQILNNDSIKVVPFDEEFNFSKANNIGVKESNGEFIILLNNDIEVVSPDWIEQLLFYCEFPDVGAVGPLLIYPDRTVQHAGVVLGIRGTADHVMRHFPSDSDGYAGSLSCPREVTSIAAACLMIKRKDYLDVGGFVEYFGTHYQDIDLNLRMFAKGKRNLFVPYAVLIHHEGVSRGKFYDFMDRALLLDIWGELIAKGDPFYNPNFSLINNQFYQEK